MTARQRNAAANAWLVTAAMSTIALCAGCGGTDFGAPVRVPPEQRQTIEAAAVGSTIAWPNDRAYNIHVKQSSQNPGHSGVAQGAADADETGRASASADVSNGGSAAGDFTIGQAIEYRGDKALRASVKVRFKLRYELQAEPIDPDTSAAVSLIALVRDSAGRVHPRIAIETLTSDDAPGTATRSDEREFSFVMEPGHGYQIVVQGSVTAGSATKGKAVARVKLSDLQMDVSLAEAPTTTATAKR